MSTEETKDVVVHIETELYPGNVTPVYAGVYKRVADAEDLFATPVFSKWDGIWWCGDRPTAQEAAAVDVMDLQQEVPWCGLTQEVPE